MGPGVIVLDTHALLWWTLDPEKLSDRAALVLESVQSHGAFASAISIWEIGIKVKRGRLGLPISVEDFALRLHRDSVIELVPVDTDIWLRSLALPWEHADPADRVIVATALAKSLPLLTKDESIQAFAGIVSIW
jgi:PIN domain nuclease of toxin-antitoxin system